MSIWYVDVLNSGWIIQKIDLDNTAFKMSLDVNECAYNNGNCSHFCQNLFGDYRCICRPGFQLLGDKRTCSGNLK